MQISVRDDLVQVGFTEDGEPDLARLFYLVARDARGAQWAHDYSRRAHRVTEDAAAAAMDTLCAKVAAHVARGGRLDPAHWIEIDPAYGSEAYQSLDAIGYFRAQEIVAAHDAGERIDQPTLDEARGVLALA